MAKMAKSSGRRTSSLDEQLQRLEDVINATERHRLLFLLVAGSPKTSVGRRALVVDEYRKSLNKLLDGLTRKGELKNHPDSVFKYQNEINDYAKRVDDMVNPDPVLKPDCGSDGGEYWKTEEIAPRKPWLTPLSGCRTLVMGSLLAVRRAVEELVETGVSVQLQEVIKKVRAYAFPGRKGPRWKTSWSYIEELDGLIEELVRVQLAIAAASGRPTKRGRPSDYDPEKDAQLKSDWEHARDAGVSKSKFAADQKPPMTAAELERVLDRARHRKTKDW